MTQEDKQLLFQDFCARLPYGVVYQMSYYSFPAKELRYSNETLRRCEITTKGEYGVGCNAATLTSITKVKPYLRPMSSMTEAEKNELLQFFPFCRGDMYFDVDNACVEVFECPNQITLYPFWDNVRLIDWLNRKMFDYRGLIPIDLAISTEEFNPYK